MTFTEAAAEVLRLVGRPLHYKEITDLAIEKNLLSHVGKSPEVTMGARLAALLKKSSKDNPLVRVKPGVFALREWDEDTIKAAMNDKTLTSPSGARSAQDEAEGGAKAEEDRAAPAGEAEDLPEWEEEEPVERAPDELMRAEMAAAGAELFGEEEDDDQPILGGADSVPPGPPSAEGGAPGQRRRRRRRRGRGRTADASFTGGGLPSYTVTPAFGEGQRAPAEEQEPPAIPVRAPSLPEVPTVSEG